jgi:hypothetical protein
MEDEGYWLGRWLDWAQVNNEPVIGLFSLIASAFPGRSSRVLLHAARWIYPGRFASMSRGQRPLTLFKNIPRENYIIRFKNRLVLEVPSVIHRPGWEERDDLRIMHDEHPHDGQTSIPEWDEMAAATQTEGRSENTVDVQNPSQNAPNRVREYLNRKHEEHIQMPGGKGRCKIGQIGGYVHGFQRRRMGLKANRNRCRKARRKEQRNGLEK